MRLNVYCYTIKTNVNKYPASALAKFQTPTSIFAKIKSIAYLATVSHGLSHTQFWKNVEEKLRSSFSSDILKSCEKSRFKIVINKKGNQFFYIIFDKKKSISKGKAIITIHKEYNSIMLGLIGGIYSKSIKFKIMATHKMNLFILCNVMRNI
ncbi:hypothetical protein [Flavobacterium sp. CF136]|uniref:hypothetical protein n=1 Tax=Flavobacterium sp. (strain CF136) TaxID=1144313 RepID=UPI0002F61284|nr:hypothetical protein [Flavobacterium sp. CF136]